MVPCGVVVARMALDHVTLVRVQAGQPDFLPPWRNRHTRQVEGLCSKGRAGSTPVGGTNDIITKFNSRSKKDLYCLGTAICFYGVFGYW